MSSDMFKRADKLNQLVMDILCQCATIKLTANNTDGSTARWIEREMESMVNKVKVYLDD
jgi:hypothetical protein